MKRIINTVHFVIMSALYAVAALLYAIYAIRLVLTMFGIGHIFNWEDWLILLLSQTITINTFFTIRHKSVMDLFGFPYDDKDLMP